VFLSISKVNNIYIYHQVAKKSHGGTMEQLLYSAPLAGIIGLVFALYLVSYIMKLDAGTEKMKAIASASLCEATCAAPMQPGKA
jgi:hypothetical protein